MPVLKPGSTKNVPPQMGELMLWLAEIAAARSQPGVCNVLRSKSAGVTTLMQDCVVIGGVAGRPRVDAGEQWAVNTGRARDRVPRHMAGLIPGSSPPGMNLRRICVENRLLVDAN